MESLSPIPLPPSSFVPRFGQSNSFVPINRFGHGNDPLEFPSLSAWSYHGNAPLEYPNPTASHSCFATLSAKTSYSGGVLARANTRGGGGGGGSLYDVLGVPPSATSDEIKSSYRKLALKYHPDVSRQANAQENFIKIKNACDTLLDSKSRREYDHGRRTSSQDYGRRTTRTSHDYYGSRTSSHEYGRRTSSTHSATSKKNQAKSSRRQRRTYYYGIGGLRFSISNNQQSEYLRRNRRGGASYTSKNHSRKGTNAEDYYYSDESILWVWHLFHNLDHIMSW